MLIPSHARLRSLLGLGGLFSCVVLLAGCSGGSGALNTSPETSLPDGVPITSSLTLGTQQAAVVLQTDGGNVSGIVDVGAAPAAGVRRPAAVVVSSGQYPFTGSLSGRHFEARGTFVAGLYSFLLSGDLPTSRRGGVMTMTADVNGDGTPDVVTASPPAFPGVSKTAATINLLINGTAGGFNGSGSVLGAGQGVYVSSGSDTVDAYCVATTGPTEPKRFVRIAIVNNAAVAAGQSYNADNTGPAVVVVTYAEVLAGTAGSRPTIRRWYSKLGTVKIQSYGGQSLTLQFNNLSMLADGLSSAAAGSFNFNGSLTVHGTSGGVTVG